MLVIRMILASIVVFSLALIGVRWLGSTQPLPSAELWGAILSNPDGSPCQLPCAFGIRFGDAKLDDAIVTLKSHPFVKKLITDQSAREYTFVQGYQLLTQPNIAIEHDPSSPQNADSLTVYYDEKTPLSLGDIFVRFGVPDYIWFNRDGNERGQWISVTLDYPVLGLRFSTTYEPNGHFELDDKISWIIIGKQIDEMSCVPPYCQKWQGFSSMSNYTYSIPQLPFGSP